MEYILFSDNDNIIVRNLTDEAEISVQSDSISIYEFLKILRENEVEPCHIQNVYDDLLAK